MALNSFFPTCNQYLTEYWPTLLGLQYYPRQSFNTYDGSSNHKKARNEEQNCFWYRWPLARSNFDCQHGVCKGCFTVWYAVANHRAQTSGVDRSVTEGGHELRCRCSRSKRCNSVPPEHESTRSCSHFSCAIFGELRCSDVYSGPACFVHNFIWSWSIEVFWSENSVFIYRTSYCPILRSVPVTSKSVIMCGTSFQVFSA